MTFNMHGFVPVKAYNGQRGCMCGCKGDYNDNVNSRAFKMRVNKVMNFVGPMRPDSDDKASYSTQAFCGDRYVVVDDNNRTTAVYFTDNK